MIDCIIAWLKISSREDMGKYKFVFFALIFIFSATIYAVYAYLFLLICTAILSYQILSLHVRNNAQDFLSTSHLSEIELLAGMFVTCVISSSFIFPIMTVLLIIKFNTGIILAFVVSSVTYIYACTLGLLIGNFIRNQITGLFIISFYFFGVVGSTDYIRQESIRYLSPLLQLNNVKEIYASNLVGLLGFSILFIAITILFRCKARKALKYSTPFALAAVMILVGNYYGDTSLNRKFHNVPYSTLQLNNNRIFYRNLDEELASYLAKLAYSFKSELNILGLPISFQAVEINRQILLFHNSTELAVVSDEGSLEINIVSPAMSEISAERHFLYIAPAIMHDDPTYTNIQHEIIACIRNQLQNKAIISNQYSIFSEQEILIAKGRLLDLRNYYLIEAQEYGKDINSLVLFFLEKHADKVDELYNLCFVENWPMTEEDVIFLLNEKYPEILNEYEGSVFR